MSPSSEHHQIELDPPGRKGVELLAVNPNQQVDMLQFVFAADQFRALLEPMAELREKIGSLLISRKKGASPTKLSFPDDKQYEALICLAQAKAIHMKFRMECLVLEVKSLMADIFREDYEVYRRGAFTTVLQSPTEGIAENYLENPRRWRDAVWEKIRNRCPDLDHYAIDDVQRLLFNSRGNTAELEIYAYYLEDTSKDEKFKPTMPFKEWRKIRGDGEGR